MLASHHCIYIFYVLRSRAMMSLLASNGQEEVSNLRQVSQAARCVARDGTALVGERVILETRRYILIKFV